MSEKLYADEAIDKYPQLEALLKDEFSNAAWRKIVRWGKRCELHVAVPVVTIELKDVDMEKPLKYLKIKHSTKEAYFVITNK
jgi:hypothetical protein